MANPFLFGKIVTGEHFCNREKEKHLLEENLKGGQSIVVISPRRMGKSSLLSVVTARLESIQDSVGNGAGVCRNNFTSRIRP
jgi:AAA+ ATPase superfamily predicted ATPase